MIPGWLKGLARVGLVIVGGLFALGLLVAGYLLVFNPFRIPETGALASHLQRDLTVAPGAAAAYELEVRHDVRIFDAIGDFDPTQLSITATTPDAASSPVELRLLARDMGPTADPDEPAALSVAPDRRSLSTAIDCESFAYHPCNVRYVLLVSNIATAEARVHLEVRASLQFPPHVPAPFLSSIHLDARELRPADGGTTLLTSEASGAVAVSPSAPLVRQAVQLPEVLGAGAVSAQSSAPPAGSPATPALTLELTATRKGPMRPVGLNAPPPVRVTLVGPGDGTVLDLGLRAGATMTVPVPPASGEHRFVFRWADWADQAYEVHWRLELASFGSAPPGAITAGAIEAAPAIDDRTTSGTTEMSFGGGSELGFGVAFETGDPGDGRFHALGAVTRLRLELDSDAGQPVTLLLEQERNGRDARAVVLRPGEPVDVTLDGRSCPYSCEAWRVALAIPPTGVPAVGRDIVVHWEHTTRLWAFDPAPPSGYFFEVFE